MGKIAFVFSGQGAQYTGMGQSLYNESPAARAVFDMAEDMRAGTKRQCFGAAADELSKTVNAQPCLFCVGLAAAESLMENGIYPDGIAGFSLGEIPALSAAGILSKAEGFKLVIKRAALMDTATRLKNGSMAAVLKLSDEKVEELCARFDGVWPANYNCPGQLVVAGEERSLRDFSAAASSEGGRIIPLAVSGAFHSPLMSAASDGLKDYLDTVALSRPAIPLYSNVTAEVYGENAAELISQQVKSPVRWRKTVEKMVADGYDTFIEVGAGKVLIGLIGKTAPEVKVFNVQDAESLKNTLEWQRQGEN